MHCVDVLISDRLSSTREAEGNLVSSNGMDRILHKLVDIMPVARINCDYTMFY